METIKGTNLGSEYMAVAKEILEAFDKDSAQAIENAASGAAKEIKKIGDAAAKSKDQVVELSEAIKKINTFKSSRNSYFMPNLVDAKNALQKFYEEWEKSGDKSAQEQKRIQGNLFKAISAFKAQFPEEMSVVTEQMEAFYKTIYDPGKKIDLRNSFGIGGETFDIGKLKEYYSVLAEELHGEQAELIKGISDGMGKAVSDELAKSINESLEKAKQQVEKQEPVFKGKSFVDQNLKRDLQQQIDDALSAVDNILRSRKTVKLLRDTNAIELKDVSKLTDFEEFRERINLAISRGYDPMTTPIRVIDKNDEKQIISLLDLIDKLNERIERVNAKRKKNEKPIALISKGDIENTSEESRQMETLLQTAQKAKAQLDQVKKFDQETRGMASKKGIEALQDLTKQGNEFGAFFDEIRKNIDGSESSAEQAIEKVKAKLRELGVVYSTETGFGKAGETQQGQQSAAKTRTSKLTPEQIKEDYIYKFWSTQSTAEYVKEAAEKDAELYYQAIVDAIQKKDVSKIYEFLDTKNLPETVISRKPEMAARRQLVGRIIGVNVSTNEKLDVAMKEFNPEGYDAYKQQLDELAEITKRQALIKDQQKEFDAQLEEGMGKKKALTGLPKEVRESYSTFFEETRQNIDGSENAVANAVTAIKEKMKELNLVFEDGKYKIVENVEAAAAQLNTTEETLTRIISLLKERQSLGNLKSTERAFKSVENGGNKNFDPNTFADILPNTEEGIRSYLEEKFYKGSWGELSNIFSAKKLWGGKTDPEAEIFGSLNSEEYKQRAAIFGKVIDEYVNQWQQSVSKFEEIKTELTNIVQGIADSMHIEIDVETLVNDLFSGINKNVTKNAENTAQWVLKGPS